MEYEYKITNQESFELADIFECGQCFRWNIQDDEKVKIVFMLAVSEEEGKGTHNDILVELSKKILDSNFRNRIENSSSIEEIVKLINE